MNGLNGDVVLDTKDVLVGYVPGEPYGFKNDLRVTVHVRMEELTRQAAYETTAHERVARPADFAITSAVWRPGYRDWISGGPGLTPLAGLTRLARGFTADDIAAVTRLGAYHLNTRKAGCAHQSVIYEKDAYGKSVPSLDLTPACPVTGYRYAHAWLVEPLPEWLTPAYVRSVLHIK